MKTAIFLFLAAFIYSCAPAVYITGSKVGNKPCGDSIKEILVAALTNDVVLRSAFERDLSSEFKKRNFRVVKSLDEFPPGFLKDSTNKQKLLDKLREKKLDAVLTISILRKENNFRYIPDGYPYDPMMNVHPFILSPGYYFSEVNYYVESNLYGGKSGELMWSAQSKTYSILSIFTITEQFAKEVVLRMISDGVLRQSSTPAITKK